MEFKLIKNVAVNYWDEAFGSELREKYQPIVAGGSVGELLRTSYYKFMENDQKITGDIDYYLTPKNFEELMDLISKGKFEVSKRVTYRRNSDGCITSIDVTTKNGQALNIVLWLGEFSVKSIVNSYDFICCMVGFSVNDYYLKGYTNLAANDIFEKRIRLTTVGYNNNPIVLLARIHKYRKKGFIITKEWVNRMKMRFLRGNLGWDLYSNITLHESEVESDNPNGILSSYSRPCVLELLETFSGKSFWEVFIEVTDEHTKY